MKEALIYEEIGRRIRQARENNDLTQEELGKLIHLTRTSITNIERGKQKIGIDTIYNLAEILNTNVFLLLPNEGVLLNYIQLPYSEEELNNLEPYIVNFAKKIYASSLRDGGI